MFAGVREEFEASDYPRRLAKLGARETGPLSKALAQALPECEPSIAPATDSSEALVTLRNVTVSYNGRWVLDGLNLEIAAGAHTLVRGPNGCGKTTLLNLVNGDSPQVYANDVTVCGIKRGSGESILDLKAKLGQVFQFGWTEQGA